MTVQLRIKRFQWEAERCKIQFWYLKQSKHETKEKIGDENWAPQNCLNPPSYEFVSESI